MIENIKRFLMYQSFQKKATNVEQIEVYYKEEHIDGTEKGAISLIVTSDMTNGHILSKEQYEGILRQIHRAYENRGYHQIRMLSMLFVLDSSDVKEFCLYEYAVHWIVDVHSKRLVLYENQGNLFESLRYQIESIVVGEIKPINVEYSSLERPRVPFRRDKFSLRYISNRYKELSYRYPVLTISIVIINVLIFLAMEFTGQTEVEDLFNWGGTSALTIIEELQIWRLFTAMFLHAGFEHIFGNMIILVLMGERLERVVGGLRYVILYLISGVIANIASALTNYYSGENPVGVGASGAIFGIVGAVMYIVIRYGERGLGITTKRLLIFIGLSLYSGFQSMDVDNTAHIVGFISGAIIMLLIDKLFMKKKRWYK